MRVDTDNIADVVGNLKLTVGASALGMNHSLWDALAVKVRQQVDQMEVLQQQRAVGAHSLGGLGVHDLNDEVFALDSGIGKVEGEEQYRAAIRGRVDWSLVIAIGLYRGIVSYKSVRLTIEALTH